MRAILVFLAVLGLSACAQQSGGSGAATPAPSATVTGTVTYLQHVALTPDAIVLVRLEDVSPANPSAQLMGEQDIVTSGRQVPIPFEIRYDPKVIDPSHSYAVSARIEQGGERLLFVTDKPVPVITRGNPGTVEIVVKPVS